MVGLYFLGILVGILMALLSKGTMFKGRRSLCDGTAQLPDARAKNVAHLLWDKAKDFLQRAFTVIFLATIVVWFLQTFDFHLNIVADSQSSILAVIAGGLSPVFAPPGFGDWRISTALIAGFMAKESVVSTLSVLFGGTDNLLLALSPWRRLPCWSFACFTPPVWRPLPPSSGSWGKVGCGRGDWSVRHCLALCLGRSCAGFGNGDGVMNLSSKLILLAILAVVVLAIRSLWKRRGQGCQGCHGHCADCQQRQPPAQSTRKHL